HPTPGFTDGAHEHTSISAEHVNRRDDYAPEREHSGDLKNGKTFGVGTVAECSEENHHFAAEVGEARQPDGSERGQAKYQRGPWHHPSETAQIGEEQSAGALPNFSGDAEKQSDGNSVR